MKPFLRTGEGGISKSFSLVLILILAVSSSLIMAKPTFAQTPTPIPIPTPSVPTFTAQPVGPPYTVPTTYSLNQSSGQVVANLGYTVEYPVVEVTVKNQPFTPYSIDNGTITINLYYNIQIKDHNQTDDWSELYSAQNFPQQSQASDYTNISLDVINGLTNQFGLVIPVGTQTDIQVEAMIGYVSTSIVLNHGIIGPYTNYTFVGETSGWSPTQTVTIPPYIPLSPTPAPSSISTTIPSSTQNPISIYEMLIAALVILIVAFVVVMAVFMRGKRR
jgi:hypothetical protein